MRSALASHRCQEWRVLRSMYRNVVRLSGGEREAGRGKAAVGTSGWMLCWPSQSQPESADSGCPVSAALVLPMVWAVAMQPAFEESRFKESWGEIPEVPVEVAFYRKYTEALLRRYVRMAMEAGKVPSLLGREMFRGNVTSCKVKSFEDVVIFKCDVEQCLALLEPGEHELISRMALQEYSLLETVAFTGLNPRTVLLRYGKALDRLTEIFLTAQMLEPQKCCQGG